MSIFLDVVAWVVLIFIAATVVGSFFVACAKEEAGKALIIVAINVATVWAICHLMVLR